MKKVIPILLVFVYNMTCAQEASLLSIADTRSTNESPSFFGHQTIKADFKLRDAIGVPGEGGYSTNLTIGQWSSTDNSGNKRHQLNFNDGGLFYRNAYSLAPQWGVWRQILMTNEDGNVGIGTEVIGYQTKFHVKESGTSNNIWRGRIVASGDINAIVLGEYNGNAWLGAHNSQLTAWSNLIIQADGGNVGIGINNPTNKLDVNGTIHSKEVKVDMNGWSDFVFKKEYELPTLEQVEKHIKEKGHLENIPSEEEVLKKGINLGEMNAKLLQKIEELTLYVIEQQKKINTQSVLIEMLQKENESFKKLSQRLFSIEEELRIKN